MPDGKPASSSPGKRTSRPQHPGRGGEHHKYLQQLIKRWAEARGYAVTIEKPILDGLGSVDVALEKGSRAIACEVSVTTDTSTKSATFKSAWPPDFEEVILISSEKKTADYRATRARRRP